MRSHIGNVQLDAVSFWCFRAPPYSSLKFVQCCAISSGHSRDFLIPITSLQEFVIDGSTWCCNKQLPLLYGHELLFGCRCEPEGVQIVEVSGTQNFFLNNFPETDIREEEC